ncbi:MAG: hypothetical protein JWR88_1065 [Pseudonocardia sp.]|nr:hypothetical protein [Pseudonocardia sp.]
MQRGIYLLPDRAALPSELARAALLAVGHHGCVVSHLTAARLHGLAVPEGGPAELTTPRALRRPNRDRLRLHTARLAPADVVDLGAILITSRARTLVDLCRALPRVAAVWAVEDALRRGLVSCGDLEAAAGRLRRTPGIVEARHRFRAAEPLSGSPLETDARLKLIEAGLPRPEVQLPVALAGGGTAFVDLGYRAERLGIELDGRASHELPPAVFADRVRQNRILLADFILLRFTWFDVVHRSERFISDVHSALEKRRTG